MQPRILLHGAYGNGNAAFYAGEGVTQRRERGLCARQQPGVGLMPGPRHLAFEQLWRLLADL